MQAASLDRNTIEMGRELYENRIRPLVESGNVGKFLVINVETGEYEMDADDVIASERAHARFPDARLYGMRIGYPAAYHLGGYGIREHR